MKKNQKKTKITLKIEDFPIHLSDAMRVMCRDHGWKMRGYVIDLIQEDLKKRQAV